MPEPTLGSFFGGFSQGIGQASQNLLLLYLRQMEMEATQAQKEKENQFAELMRQMEMYQFRMESLDNRTKIQLSVETDPKRRQDIATAAATMRDQLNQQYLGRLGGGGAPGLRLPGGGGGAPSRGGARKQTKTPSTPRVLAGFFAGLPGYEGTEIEDFPSVGPHAPGFDEQEAARVKAFGKNPPGALDNVTLKKKVSHKGATLLGGLGAVGRGAAEKVLREGIYALLGKGGKKGIVEKVYDRFKNGPPARKMTAPEKKAWSNALNELKEAVKHERKESARTLRLAGEGADRYAGLDALLSQAPPRTTVGPNAEWAGVGVRSFEGDAARVPEANRPGSLDEILRQRTRQNFLSEIGVGAGPVGDRTPAKPMTVGAFAKQTQDALDDYNIRQYAEPSAEDVQAILEPEVRAGGTATGTPEPGTVEEATNWIVDAVNVFTRVQRYEKTPKRFRGPIFKELKRRLPGAEFDLFNAIWRHTGSPLR